MSDVLAHAIYRAKLARQTPQIVNVYSPQDEEIARLKAENKSVLDKNQELMGIIRGLRTSRRDLLVELDLVKKMLSVPEIAVKVSTLPDIVSVVARVFDVLPQEIRSANRSRHIALARQAAVYLSRKITNHSSSLIGRYFRRDHSTILTSIDKITELRKVDTDIDERLKAVENRFAPASPTEAVQA